jgi:rRNA-processing protein FCF1
VLALIGAGLGVAASSAHAQSSTAKAQKAAKRLAAKRWVLRAAAQHIGIDVRQLRRELRGHSLAQVAEAHGKTSAGLQQALVAARDATLDRRVARNQITQAQADQRLARFQDRVDELVNVVFRARGARLGGGLLKAAANYIGIPRRQLRQELPGHSLAQVAEAHGKTSAGLQQALVAARDAKLDRRVARNQLTQAQADQRLARFQDRVDELVNRVWPSR